MSFDIQALMNGVSAQWQRERAETQMTLGKLIAALNAMPPDTEIANLHSPHSYRGYYEDLAFSHDIGSRHACDLLAECKAAMGKAFIGYKGGDYVMGETTPIWLAEYGCCGKKLMALNAGGDIETAEDEG